jgi:hypothetical protein
MPKWNTGAAASNQQAMIQGVYTCASTLNLDAGLDCVFSNDVLTLTKINVNNELAATTICNFTVSGFRNPMSTLARSGITLTTFASDGGKIDSADMSVTATTPITITSATASSDGTKTVNEPSDVKISFPVPIDMDSGCIVDVKFPTEMGTSSTILTTVKEVQSTGANKTSTGSLDTGTNTYSITNFCETYRTTDYNATFYFVQVTSPISTKPSSSFEITLKDSGSNNIATVSSGVTYTATYGSLTINTVTADNTIVGGSTAVTFNFKPSHKIPISSYLVVTLPAEASITARTTTTCTMTNLNEIQNSAT